MTSISAIYPTDFTTAMHKLLGPEAPDFFEAQAQRAPVSLRLNPAKIRVSSATPLPAQFEPVPWCAQGYYLQDRPLFTLDPRFHGGAYYVQDASCMLLSAALQQLPEWSKAERVLDLCAAPGGKSTLLKSVLPAQACLVANEVIPARGTILAENLTKWGADRVLVTRNQARDFQHLTQGFDVIVVDAPCSGEGLFRRQPEAIQEWSPAQVAVCAQRQEDIICDIWPALAEEGLLIYSTCTWNPQENEDLLAALQHRLNFEIIPLDFDTQWGVHGQDGIYRCLPHRLAGEGFSLCVLRKKDPRQVQRASRSKSTKRQHTPNKKQPPQVIPKECLEWLPHEKASLWCVDDTLYHWPLAHRPFLHEVQQHLRLVTGPLAIAQAKGKHWIPSTAWLMSACFNPEAFQELSVDLNTALQYLYGEALPVSAQTTTSAWQWVSYAGLPLGWVKATPTHYNNYWPKPWKIRQRFPEIDPEQNIRLCLPVHAVSGPNKL